VVCLRICLILALQAVTETAGGDLNVAIYMVYWQQVNDVSGYIRAPISSKYSKNLEALHLKFCHGRNH